MVFVAVGQDDTDDVIESVLDRSEVGEDEVDAGLCFFGEQHATVDDEEPTVELEHGHVATDLAESAERDDTQ